MAWKLSAPPCNSGTKPDILEAARDTCYVFQIHMRCGVLKQGLDLLQQGKDLRVQCCSAGGLVISVSRTSYLSGGNIFCGGQVYLERRLREADLLLCRLSFSFLSLLSLSLSFSFAFSFSLSLALALSLCLSLSFRLSEGDVLRSRLLLSLLTFPSLLPFSRCEASLLLPCLLFVGASLPARRNKRDNNYEQNAHGP